MQEADEHQLKEFNMLLRNNIYYYMKKKNVPTIAKLSQMIGVHKQTIYALLAPYSTSNTTSLIIVRLERLFDLDTGELLRERK